MLSFSLLLYWMGFQSKVLSWLNSKKFCSIVSFTTSSSPYLSCCFLNSSFSLSAALHFLLSSPNQKLLEGRESTDYLLFCLLQYLAQWPSMNGIRKWLLNWIQPKKMFTLSVSCCTMFKSWELGRERLSEEFTFLLLCSFALIFTLIQKKTPRNFV